LVKRKGESYQSAFIATEILDFFEFLTFQNLARGILKFRLSLKGTKSSQRKEILKERGSNTLGFEVKRTAKPR